MKKNIERNINKPSPKAKALSLFLMAYKTTDPSYKEKAKRLNKRWDMVKAEKLSKDDYMKEVLLTLQMYGGYSEVIEKTVQFYIDKTGEWKLQGDDKYCQDARKIADRLLNT